jgi:hypothetical protein
VDAGRLSLYAAVLLEEPNYFDVRIPDNVIRRPELRQFGYRDIEIERSLPTFFGRPREATREEAFFDEFSSIWRGPIALRGSLVQWREKRQLHLPWIGYG